MRDVVDFLEFDINPEKWINRLLQKIRTGHYEPESPVRFLLAKSRGFSRRMTLLHIPDLVLYRTIVDHLYTRMKRFEQEHAYFERGTLPRDQTRIVTRSIPSSWEKLITSASDYDSTSKKSFRAWLCYNQYRKFLIFRKVYPYIVNTDITNFFDSVLHARIAESLHVIGTPPRMIGLLFFLLERFSIRESFSESPRIGLPVDEFGCSRKLAHMLLFPHDARIVERFGTQSYVRWMDDQNIGVRSYAEGLRALATVGESLGRMHLCPNSKKSTVLSLSEARRYFHLDINKLLDEADELTKNSARAPRALRRAVMKIWKRCCQHEGIGHWDKILKRVYRLAARPKMRFFRKRAARDSLSEPLLTGRIADYMRCTGTVKEFREFATSVWAHENQVYGDVNRVLIESLLRLEPDVAEKRILRGIGSLLLKGRFPYPGVNECMPVAPLLILRFGDIRSITLLRTCFQDSRDELPPQCIRAAAIVYAGYGHAYATELRRTASRLLRNHLSEMIKMMDAIEDYDKVPERFLQRVDVSFDNVMNQSYIDMRSLVVARLLGLNRKPDVRRWLADRRRYLLSKSLSNFDQDLIQKLWPK